MEAYDPWAPDFHNSIACCRGWWRTDLPFSLLRLSIARIEMKTTGENHKGVRMRKREDKCALLNFLFKKEKCLQAG